MALTSTDLALPQKHRQATVYWTPSASIPSHSRSSFLAGFNADEVSLHKPKQSSTHLAPLPLLLSSLWCPRRTFLASLILASKFMQDRCYSNRAWAKLSGLPLREIGRCERALVKRLSGASGLVSCLQRVSHRCILFFRQHSHLSPLPCLLPFSTCQSDLPIFFCLVIYLTSNVFVLVLVTLYKLTVTRLLLVLYYPAVSVLFGHTNKLLTQATYILPYSLVKINLLDPFFGALDLACLDKPC